MTTTGSSPEAGGRAEVEPAVACELLRRMVLIRQTEEAIAERYSRRLMRCPTHLCTGQEAVAAGVCLGLRPDDCVVSTHRAHGHYLAKGGDLDRLLAEIHGRATGCCGGKGGSMHLVDRAVGFMGSTAIVGGTIPVGVGLALATHLRHGDQVSVVFLGDAAVEEGVFAESVNVAVLKQLPVLFVCENNLYSVYSPLVVRQPPERSLVELVRAMGCAAEAGDGNDAPGVYAAVRRVLPGLRAGRGPAFFEFRTYRWREHCGPNYDNDIGYRSPAEFAAWKARDPVRRLAAELVAAGVLDSDRVEALQAEAHQRVDAALDRAEQAPFPPPAAAFSGIYAGGPA